MTEHAHSSTAAPASVVVDNMAEHASPPLWNPIAIGLWSILLTPIFGATLQLLNWKALGDEGNARISRYWLFGFIVYCAALAVVPMLSPASSQIADSTYGVGFLLLVAWNMTAGKAQYLHVLRRFGPSYRRRSWFARC